MLSSVFTPSAGRRLLPAVAAVLLASTACGGTTRTEPDPDGDMLVTIGLINGDALAGQPIHLFGPAEDFPCCQVAQLSNRDVVVTVKQGAKLTFRAGRSGTILKTVTCTVNNDAGKIVRWTPTANGSNSGTLSCHTGW